MRAAFGRRENIWEITMKKLLLIATGGTIASENAGEGLKPLIGAESLLMRAPKIQKMYSVNAVQPVNLDSTNMRPENWLRIADCIRINYDAYDGFVVSHGTDTMAYTAAALSYLVKDSPKPIAITGAQKSIASEDTDARTNLYDAFAYASDAGSHGVSIVFDGRVIAGTRARKVRTKSRNAFESVDFPNLAIVRDGRILRYIPEPVPDGPAFSDALESKVAVLKLTPGLGADALRALRQCLQALVVESFGVGGVPNSDGGALLEELKNWKNEGKVVAVTTQVPYEGSDMALYEVGRRALAEGGVFEAYTMTPETAVVKLMWILARTRDVNEVRRLFYAPVAHDLLILEPPSE